MKVEIPDYLIEMIREEIGLADVPPLPNESYASMLARIAEQSGRRLSMLRMISEVCAETKP